MSPSSASSSTLPVPSSSRPQPQAGPSSYRFGASPRIASGGMSIDQSYGKSYRMPGGAPGSYGARFYGVPQESPHFQPQSVTMEGQSYLASPAAFGLPRMDSAGSISSSFRQGRSYAAAARGDRDFYPDGLSTSFASMSFRPGMSVSMSFGGNSYSKSQVHSLMANRARTDAELTKTYECCGETHKGLHELLEHVEDMHPFLDDNGAYPQPGTTNGPTQTQIGFSPQVLAMDLELEQPELSALGTIGEEGLTSTQGSQRSSLSPIAAPSLPSYPVPTSASAGGSKPPSPPSGIDNATSPPPLQISDILTSPFTESLLASKSPNHPLTGLGGVSKSNSSSPPEGTIQTPSTSVHASPVFNVPKVNPNRVGGFLGTQARPQAGRFDRAFNEVVSGGGSPSGANGLSPSMRLKDQKSQPTAVAPGMLFASAVAGLGIPTAPPGSAAAQAQAQQAQAQVQAQNALAGPSGPTTPGIPGVAPPSGPSTPVIKNEDGEHHTPIAPTNANMALAMSGISMGLGGEQALPQPSLFTTHKPWRCPNPGCNKAYKQSNGLKYHQQKGQCDFAIHDAVDLGLSIEEAEERSRPFVCAVGAGCTKRYRQMNGLKYHYLNSGEHGKYGLRMLQNGTHPQPSGVAAVTKKPPTTPLGNTARPTGAPYQIPSQLGQTRPLGHLAGQSNANGGGSANGTGNANGNGQNGIASPAGGQGHGLPRMGVFPPRPGQPGGPHSSQNGGAGPMRAALPGMGVGGTNGSNGPIRPGAPGTNGSNFPPRPNTNGQGLPARTLGTMPVPGTQGYSQLHNRPQGAALGSQNQNQHGVRPPIPAPPPPKVEPPVQRGRDAVLFAAVDTMDL